METHELQSYRLLEKIIQAGGTVQENKLSATNLVLFRLTNRGFIREVNHGFYTITGAGTAEVERMNRLTSH